MSFFLFDLLDLSKSNSSIAKNFIWWQFLYSERLIPSPFVLNLIFQEQETITKANPSLLVASIMHALFFAGDLFNLLT